MEESRTKTWLQVRSGKNAPSPPQSPDKWLSDEGSQAAPRQCPGQLSAGCRGFHSASPQQAVALYPWTQPYLLLVGNSGVLRPWGKFLLPSRTQRQ